MSAPSPSTVELVPGAPEAQATIPYALPKELVAGKYRIEGIVGSGGMGIVVSAVHARLGERVAIKLLRPEMSHQPQALARCLREARAAIRLRGEHVVRVFDAGALEDGRPYIVMELLEGTDLAALLRSARRLPLAIAVDYVLQACTAIAEAHAAGIIHRDLKPANLFLVRRVDGSACIKVLDFGISKSMDTERESPTGVDPSWDRGAGGPPAAHEGVKGARLAPTRAAGSPRYMAPEQMRGEPSVDARADVWALGAILHELVSGVPAFDADLPEALRSAVLERSPPSLSPHGVPRSLETIVLHCLEKDRERRCPEVATLARALAPFGSDGSKAMASRVARILEGAGHPREAWALPARAPLEPSFWALRVPLWAVAFTLAVLGSGAALYVATRTGASVPATHAAPPGIPLRPSAISESDVPTGKNVPLVEARAARVPEPAPMPEAPFPATSERRGVHAPSPSRSVASSAPSSVPVAAPSASPSDEFLSVPGGELFRERR